MPSRVAPNYTGSQYKFGFNGKEQDDEVKGFGSQIDYAFRIHDPRIGRFLSVDPLTRSYPMLTPYQFASNRPIDGIDLDGLEWSGFLNIWADKVKEKGHPRLAGFIRSLGAGDINGQVLNAMDNVRKGNFKAVAHQALSYTDVGMQIGLVHKIKDAANGDREAQGELAGMAFQGLVFHSIGSKRGATFTEVVDQPLTVTNKQAAAVNSGKATVDPMIPEMSRPLTEPLPSIKEFTWQKNKAMNDIISKSIHPDVYNSKGVKVGEVGFELENGIITPKALGRNLTNESKAFITKIGQKQLETPGFNEELLQKVNEALNSGQIPTTTNRYQKLLEMKKMLTPTSKIIMKNIELNDLFINARFCEHIKVGLTKENIEQLLGLKLGKPDIETSDLSLYYIELKTDFVVSIIFDKKNVCYEINLEFEENKEAKFFIQLDKSIEEINENTSFEHLLSVISKLNIGWEFDSKRVYLQTVCVLLDNGVRFYYSFGNKKEKDYGLFSIKLILENHELTVI